MEPFLFVLVLAMLWLVRYQVIALAFMLMAFLIWAVCALGLAVAFVVCFIDCKIKEWTK